MNNLPDISKWNLSNANNISLLFFNCNSLSSLPNISKWNINKVNNMDFIFEGCNSLSFFPDISKWNINNNRNTSNIKISIPLSDISKLELDAKINNYDPSLVYKFDSKNLEEVPLDSLSSNDEKDKLSKKNNENEIKLISPYNANNSFDFAFDNQSLQDYYENFYNI